MAIFRAGDGGRQSVTENSSHVLRNDTLAQARTGYGDVTGRQKAHICSDFCRFADTKPTCDAEKTSGSLERVPTCADATGGGTATTPHALAGWRSSARRPRAQSGPKSGVQVSGAYADALRRKT